MSEFEAEMRDLALIEFASIKIPPLTEDEAALAPEAPYMWVQAVHRLVATILAQKPPRSSAALRYQDLVQDQVESAAAPEAPAAQGQETP